MKLEYFGHSCFRIISNNGNCLVTDPYTKVGYELPKDLLTDIVTLSHGHFDHNYVQGLRGARIVVQEAKKYNFDYKFIALFVFDFCRKKSIYF